MQQDMIPNRLLLFLGLIIALFNIFYTFKNFVEKDTIVICTEKSGTTAVVNMKTRDPIIIAESSAKDMLSCIGKSIPYYTRTVGKIITTDQRNKQVLGERYNLNSQDESEYANLYIDKNMYFIRLEDKLIIIGAKENISPFTLEKHISQSVYTIVYMPENSHQIDQLTQKIVEGKGGEFHTLKLGEIVAKTLLGRS